MVLADTSALFALVVDSDANHQRAAECSRRLREERAQVWTATHLVQELWMLINARAGYARADDVITGALAKGLVVVGFDAADIARALAVASEYPDQEFSLADRISFVLLDRHGRDRVWTYDRDFAVYRYGTDRSAAFTIVQ